MQRDLRWIAWLGLALALAGCGAAQGTGPGSAPGLPATLAAPAATAAPGTAAPGTPRPAVAEATRSPSATADSAQAALADRLNGLDASLAAQAEAKTFGGAVLVGQGG